MRRVAREQGLIEGVLPERLGEREVTRQNDLARLVRLADEFDDGARDVSDFIADLEARFGANADAAGLHLLTYHRAKGLEFEAVFLPRLEERELPIRQATGGEALAEERRLLYVGMTRAIRHLFITCAGPPSRFLSELGLSLPSREPRREARGRARDAPEHPLFGVLTKWRRERAKADGIAAYLVFHNTTLDEIARRAPRNARELAAVPGVGPAKLERYGEDVLATLAPELD